MSSDEFSILLLLVLFMRAWSGGVWVGLNAWGEEIPLTAIPNIPLCPNVATFTSNSGSFIIVLFTILLTIPVSFSMTKMLLLSKNAKSVGYVSPLNTTSVFRLGSAIIGPVGRGKLLSE